MKLPLLQIARITAWSLASIVVSLSVVPPHLRPETGAPNALEHFAIYFITAFSFGLGYDLGLGLLTTLLVTFCGLIEIVQLLVPGRHARLSDFIVDALAVCVGSILALMITRERRRRL